MASCDVAHAAGAHSAGPLSPIRCAIYTRKSTEEGLEQEFNSLDAQRELAEAYIASQHSEGWTCLAERYDDGGFSGGTIERPALKRLLADVQEGRISALVEMYVQGVSTRKVKAITEPLCGHEFSASSVSRVNKTLDEQLAQFCQRPLEEPYPYFVLDARYEKVREDGVIRSRAVLVAIGIHGDGRRCILGVELANRESRSRWRDFLIRLKERGLRDVEFIVSDDHEGLKKAVSETLPPAVRQRCYVHFLRNALDYLPRKADDDCMTERRWIYDRRTLEEAQRDVAAWLQKWHTRYAKLCAWVESNIEETFAFYRLPLQHHKHMKPPHICSSGSSRQSSGGPTSCGSFLTKRAVSGSFGHWR